MKFGSLFSGIGGFDLGFERAGMECAWQVEIDTKASEVLAKHWPDVARYSDVRTVGKHNLEPVDVICGGFPCQDVSLAGERAGLEGKRSTLWSEFARIVCELRPEWIVVENVFGLFSSDDGRFFGNILRELAACGYDAEWEVLPASIFGAPHKRERVFIVSYSNGERCRYPLERFQEIRFFDKLPTHYLWSGSIESPIRRVDDGLSWWVDANRQLGNAVVPQIAEWIGKRIGELNAILYPGQFVNPNNPKIGKPMTVGAENNPILDGELSTI